MKRNILLIFLVAFTSIILIYPLGKILNQFYFHEFGSGFDVGLDNDYLLGFIAGTPLISGLFFGFFGKTNWKWLSSFICSLPSIIFVIRIEFHQLVPFVFLFSGIFLSLIINHFRKPKIQTP